MNNTNTKTLITDFKPLDLAQLSYINDHTEDSSALESVFNQLQDLDIDADISGDISHIWGSNSLNQY